MGDIFSLVLMLVVMVLILYGSYFFTKYLGIKTVGKSMGNNLKIVDSLMISQEKTIIIVEAVGKFYMLGVSNNNINLIKELEECPDIKLDEPPDSFKLALEEVIKKRKKNTRS